LGEKLACTGVLLVGGESRRMGRNKAFLEIEGQTLLERSLQVLDRVCAEVFISCRENTMYQDFGFKTIPDLIKGQGPMAGLYAALQQANYEYMFIVACDMPFLNAEAITCLHGFCEDYDIILPSVSGKVHTLHAYYHKRILPFIERDLKANKLSINRAIFGGSLNELNKRVIAIEKEIVDPRMQNIFIKSLVNVNTPQEWESMVEKVKTK
jgi:molybdopterin-guanine dinucleotide biosynthesis protein A